MPTKTADIGSLTQAPFSWELNTLTKPVPCIIHGDKGQANNDHNSKSYMLSKIQLFWAFRATSPRLDCSHHVMFLSCWGARNCVFVNVCDLTQTFDLLSFRAVNPTQVCARETSKGLAHLYNKPCSASLHIRDAAMSRWTHMHVRCICLNVCYTHTHHISVCLHVWACIHTHTQTHTHIQP